MSTPPLPPCYVVINPAAGHGKAGREYPKVLERLAPYFGRIEHALTAAPGQATEMVRKVLPEYRHVFCLGGDGTSFEVLNGIMASGYADQTCFGTLPLGTGNSFLKDFGIETIEDVLGRVRTGATRPVDVGRARWDGGECWFRNILGFGLIADICERTNRQFKFAGEAGYSLGVLAEVIHLGHELITLTVDGESREIDNCTLAVSNSRYTGGKMLIAPQADACDGELDLVLINRTSRVGLLQAFSGIFSGRHLEHPQVQTLKGKRISIETAAPRILMIDGEVLGQTPVAIETLPGALRIYA